jgi:glycosyltransferase involved in cell wall biosynthesis
MKVAYIIIQPYDSLAGPFENLKSRAESAVKLGLDLEFIVLNRDLDNRIGNIQFIKLKFRNAMGLFWAANFAKFNLIDKSLDLSIYDYIIVRYSFADRSGISFAKKYRLITEHHADTISEMRSYLSERPSLIKAFFRFIKLHLEKQYGHKILEQCRGFIGVTDEIRSIEKLRINSKIPSITIPNGINVKKIEMTGFVPFDGRTLNMVYISSNAFPWGGLERLLKSLVKYRGDVKIILHVIGPIERSKIFKHKYSLIQFHGPKFGKSLDAIMKNMNLAVSILELHKKGLKEACPLRTREYVARGIPFINAYEDRDLMHVDPQKKFYLSFRNDDSLIEIEKIISFAKNMAKREGDIPQYMRDYALKYLNISAKTGKLWEFIKSIDKAQGMAEL